jgi:mRNA interferase RelE/StbE
MADEYDIQIAPAAERQLRKLPPQAQVKIFKALESLASNPRPAGVEKLSADPRFWRVRAGDYRVVYFIDDGVHLLIVLVARHRKDAYRDIENLDPAVVAKSIGPMLSARL